MKTLYLNSELALAALTIKKNLLKLCSMQNIHIGGDLSSADYMTVLWRYKMRYNPDDPKDESRDRFIMSKGHGAALVSFCQASIGCYDIEDIFNEYATDTGRFSMHSCNLMNPYVEFSTGSLGHGLSLAAGIAIGLRIKKNNNSRVYVVMGDGEQSEGSVWEAVMSAANYQLGNLVAILDYNKLCADGKVSEISGLRDFASKYREFGWQAFDVDGHDIKALKDVFDALPSPESKKPTLIVCHTTKGKGVSFMENQPGWHAGKITLEQYEKCIKILEKEFVDKWGMEYESGK